MCRVPNSGLLPGGNSSEARGTSIGGRVIIGISNSSQLSEFQAFRQWSNNAPTALPNLDGGYLWNEANDISYDGRRTVGTGYSNRGYEAVLWDAWNIQGLGDLPGGAFYSKSHAISASGLTVVGSSISYNGLEAFIWEETEGMIEGKKKPALRESGGRRY